jgi:DNA-binding MarR family transcriptional regulator
MADETRFHSAAEAANDPRVLAFGRLLGAANRLEFLLGRDLEERLGLPHVMYELLLLVGRAGEEGLPIREIAQARVLTSGGATRLVQRALAQGLVTRTHSARDARVQLIHLTPVGARTVTEASNVHVRNIERHLVEVLGDDEMASFSTMIRKLSESAARSLPVMP